MIGELTKIVDTSTRVSDQRIATGCRNILEYNHSIPAGSVEKVVEFINSAQEYLA